MGSTTICSMYVLFYKESAKGKKIAASNSFVSLTIRGEYRCKELCSNDDPWKVQTRTENLKNAALSENP